MNMSANEFECGTLSFISYNYALYEFQILSSFGLVWFYGISTIIGYLTLNPLYTYILNI